MKVIRSAKPYWIYLILTEKKKAEVGKNFPKSSDWDGTVEMYCSKDKTSFSLIPKAEQEWMREYLGKVACSFTCEKIDKYNTSWLDGEDRLKSKTCLDDVEIMDYMDCYTDRKFYCWNISDLKVYKKPKDLREFTHCCGKSCSKCRYGSRNCNGTLECNNIVTTPPQSWFYIAG